MAGLALRVPDWLHQRADLTPKELRLLEHMARKMRQASPRAENGKATE